MTDQTNPDLPPRWDLSNVYPALESPEYQADFEAFKAQVSALEAFMTDNKIAKTASLPEKDPARLASLLDELITRLNEIYALGSTMRAYLTSFVTTDSFNHTARRMMSLLEREFVQLQQLSIRFQGWIGSIKDVLPEVLSLPGAAQAHAFTLLETAEQSKYMMSDAEESLAAELMPSGASAWARLQGTITSQMKVPFELDGKVQELPMPALINLRNHPDEDVRRRAYEAENKAWETVKEPLAAALNGVKGTVNVLDKRRGRIDALHSSIDLARIDRATLEAMLSAMEDSFPMFRKYFHAKARRLGKEKLAWWDLFAPVGKVERRLTFAEAAQFVVRQFNEFSPELAAFAQRAFDHAWVDAEMREGKSGGAFCMGLKRVGESRILMNFDGSLDSVFTLAHELGHGFHNECLKSKTILQSQTPMTLAETASIMCETIVTNAAIKEAASPAEELAILETSLISDAGVIVDIYSRYLFEKEVFERRAEAELSAEDFNDIMLRAQKATYGDGLDEHYLQKFMWTWKGHYYRPGLSFYNYPYAFGLLFGLGLYSVYQQRGAAFVEDYKQLLASTGEGTAAELAARFGLDIRQKAFWANSLGIVNQRVERYLAL